MKNISMDTTRHHKSQRAAIWFSWFGGILSFDRFYLGYVGSGILKLLTMGGLGIWALIDFILIATGKLGPADGSLYKEDARHEQIISEIASLKKLLTEKPAPAVSAAASAAESADLQLPKL